MTKMLDNAIGVPDRWITMTDAAALCGINPRTLRRWELDGSGPPVYRYKNKTLRYREAEVREWIMSRRNAKTSA